jgi:hypothetical protein
VFATREGLGYSLVLGLEPTPELRQIFQDIHPHFLDEKYIGFQVLTQTCDLVRRGNETCKSRYVNLAVVRPIDQILGLLLDRLCNPVELGGKVISGLFTTDERYKAEQLLSRVFNENEQAAGLFYLHPDTSVRIAVPSVALLQVSVAVRAYEHYDVLVGSRTGRLAPAFRDKLGWLVGNLFARVATPDMPRKMCDDLVGQLLGTPSPGTQPGVPIRWLPKRLVKEAKKQNVQIEGDLTLDQIIELIAQHEPPGSTQVACDRVISVIRSVISDLPTEQEESIKVRLKNDATFRSVLKSET